MPLSEPPNPRAASRWRRTAPAGAPHRPPAIAAAAVPPWATPALWAALALLLALRLAAPLAPGMALWSLNLARFLAPAAAWLPWAVAFLACAAALLPPSRRAVERAIGAADARRALTASALAAALALTVWSLPDRLHFTGDFVMREGAISTSQQHLRQLPFAPGQFGEIIDPRREAPAEVETIVSVMTPSATRADALSTTLLLLPVPDGEELLARVYALARRGDAREIEHETLPVTRDEPLRREIADFLDCVRTRSAPRVSGADGRRALVLAMRIARAAADASRA